VKSVLTAIESTLRKLDEKVRIVQGSLGRERFGFRSRSVGRLLVLPSTNVARRRVSQSSEVLDVAFPDRAGRVRGWLRVPEGTLAGSSLCHLPTRVVISAWLAARSGSEGPEEVG